MTNNETMICTKFCLSWNIKIKLFLKEHWEITLSCQVCKYIKKLLLENSCECIYVYKYIVVLCSQILTFSHYWDERIGITLQSKFSIEIKSKGRISQIIVQVTVIRKSKSTLDHPGPIEQCRKISFWEIYFHTVLL